VCKIRNHYLLVDYTLTEAAVLAIMREGGEEAKGGVGGAQTRDGHVMLREATRKVMRNDIHRAYLQAPMSGGGNGGRDHADGDVSVTYDELKFWAQGLVINISDIQVADLWREALDAVRQNPFQAHITSSFHEPSGDRLTLDHMSSVAEVLVRQEWGSLAAAKVAVVLECGLAGCGVS
jgi:hypothetical protein